MTYAYSAKPNVIPEEGGGGGGENPETKDYLVSVVSSPADGPLAVASGGVIRSSGVWVFRDGSLCTVRVVGFDFKYLFSHWLVNGERFNDDGSLTFRFIVRGDTAVSAVFSEVIDPEIPDPDPDPDGEYNVSVVVTPAGGGTVTGGGSYLPGASVTLSATPAAGMLFDAWLYNGQIVGQSSSISFSMPNFAIQATARFREESSSVDTFTVSVAASPAGGGTVTGGGTYTPNDPVTVAATATEGWLFDYWMIGNSKLSDSASFTFAMPENNVSLTAVFHHNEEEVDLDGEDDYSTEPGPLTKPDGSYLNWEMTLPDGSYPLISEVQFRVEVKVWENGGLYPFNGDFNLALYSGSALLYGDPDFFMRFDDVALVRSDEQFDLHLFSDLPAPEDERGYPVRLKATLTQDVHEGESEAQVDVKYYDVFVKYSDADVFIITAPGTVYPDTVFEMSVMAATASGDRIEDYVPTSHVDITHESAWLFEPERLFRRLTETIFWVEGEKFFSGQFSGAEATGPVTLTLTDHTRQMEGTVEIMVAVPELVFTVEPTHLTKYLPYTLTVEIQDGAGNTLDIDGPGELEVVSLPEGAFWDDSATTTFNFVNGVAHLDLILDEDQTIAGTGTVSLRVLSADPALAKDLDLSLVQPLLVFSGVPSPSIFRGENTVMSLELQTVGGTTLTEFHNVTGRMDMEVTGGDIFLSASGGAVKETDTGLLLTWSNGVCTANFVMDNGEGSPNATFTAEYSDLTAVEVVGIADKLFQLYAGGDFNSPASRIAGWDQTSWSALGTGFNGDCYALAFAPNGDLYAGGDFTTAGGVSANRVARWDGTSWSALGTGFNGDCYALAFAPNGDLYAGGDFTTAGGIPANNIAKWDGAWHPLGSGLSNYCLALAFAPNGNLYAGGYFTTAGGEPADYIARWNGTSWSALGSGFNGICRALAFAGGNLYAGGSFTTAGGVDANRVAKWDGAWHPLGSGLNNNCLAFAFAPNGNLYAGGAFTTAGGVSANFIAKWDGAWHPLGSGLDFICRALAFAGGNLYAGGNFTTAGGEPADYIAKWDGTNWSPLGSGLGNRCRSIAIDEF